MPFSRLPGCGLLFELAPYSRRARLLIARQLGWRLRSRTESDGRITALSFAMSVQDVGWAAQIAEEAGCKEGKDFAVFAGDSIIGTVPDWLQVRQEAPSDPWLGLRPETWDRMASDVRDIYEKMRLAKSTIIRHAHDPRGH